MLGQFYYKTKEQMIDLKKELLYYEETTNLLRNQLKEKKKELEEIEKLINRKAPE